MSTQTFVPRSAGAGSFEGRSLPAGRERPGRRVEALALLAHAGALFVALALASYGGEQMGGPLETGWMGAAGDGVAGLLSAAFGWASWFVPIELGLLGAPLFRGRRPELLALRLSGDLLLLVLGAALLQVAFPEARAFGSAGPGGGVGLFFGELMRGLFSGPGSFLVGSTGILLLLVGRASVSFLLACERLWTLAKLLGRWMLSAVARGQAAWKKAALLRRAQELETRPLPRIESEGRDEAIVHRLEDDVPWVPFEATGVPPLTLAQSLSSHFGLGSGLSSSSDSGLDSGPGSERPSTSEMDPLARALCEASVGDASVDEASASAAEVRRIVDPEAGARELGAALVDVGDFFARRQARDPEAAGEPEAESEAAEHSEEAGATEGAGALADAPVIVEAAPEADVRPMPARRPRRRSASRVEPIFELPSTELLEAASQNPTSIDRGVMFEKAELLERTLQNYGVVGKVEEIHPGPTVTTYEVAPAVGTKVSKVAGLSDDLALGLSRKVRIIAPIPGKSRIGFEIPNDQRTPVNLRELIEDERFDELSEVAPLPVVLGRDIVGAPFYADLASMPHVIVAGATGAGKSVGLNVMLASLLFRRTPEELRLLMIDPKVVELAPFDRIPHLLLPVVTDMKQAAQALRWAVDEMERRYQLFADAGTKNIGTYNRYVQRIFEGEIPAPRHKQVEAVDENGDLTLLKAAASGSDGVSLPERLPYIVIVIDEFADLMMQQGKEVEASVARLAQKARAAGMHVILATQRPSVDVITGMIKANFPSRIAFRVAQKIDARTILDEQGAEVLLGKGDMLVKLNGGSETRRVQCPFLSEEEVSQLTDHLRRQGEPRYQESILAAEEDEEKAEAPETSDDRFDEAVLIVRETQRCSTSWLQRKLTIGYNRAAKIVEMMERRGYVGPPNGSRDREVFIPPGGP